MTVRLLMPLYNRVGKGTYWRALGFAEALSRQGYEVTLLAVAANRKRGFVEREVNGVKLVETPDLLPSSGYDLWDALNRIAWVKRRPFDLIHAFETRPVNIFPALYGRKRYNIPLLTDWCDWFGRGGSVEQRSNWLLRTILRPIETFFEERFRPGAAGTTVINNILRQKALALGIPAERLLLLPNGANVNDIRPQPKERVRAKLGLPADAIILGYTGTLFAEDARLMAAAFDAIQAKLPQARLLLIGYTNFPVEEMVKVKAAVQRTGPVNYEQLADYVAACDAGWLPLADNAANRGRFPMKAHDFMAAGRPLIVTDVGDLGPFVQQWQIGYTAEAAAAPLAETVLTAVAQPDILRQQGEQARRVAEEQFAWPIVAAKLDQFYRQFL
jgi:glycosyltransferase involved in cell wall biosynthesis